MLFKTFTINGECKDNVINTDLSNVVDNAKFNRRLNYIHVSAKFDQTTKSIESKENQEIKLKSIEDKSPEDILKLAKLAEDIQALNNVLDRYIKKYYEGTDSFMNSFDQDEITSAKADDFAKMFMSSISGTNCSLGGIDTLVTLLTDYYAEKFVDGTDFWTDTRDAKFKAIKHKLNVIVGQFDTREDGVYKNSKINLNNQDTIDIIRYYWNGYKFNKNGDSVPTYRSESEMKKEIIQLCWNKAQKRSESKPTAKPKTEPKKQGKKSK